MEKIIAVIIDYETSPYLTKPIDHKGRSSFDIVLDKVSRLDIPYYVFSSTSKKGTFSFNGDLFSLLNTIQEKLPSFEHLIFFHSEMPLVDNDLTKRIISSHLDNIADYTFGEHYPEGFSPFIIQYGTFKKLQLITQGNNEPYNFKSIEKLIQLDINSYDVEIVISPTDLRIIRDSFRVSDKRNFLMIQKFLEIYDEQKDLYQFFKTHSSSLRLLPSYIHIELTNQCNQLCPNCPFTHKTNGNTFLSINDLSTILNSLKEFIGSAKILISGYGEPLLHPEFNSVLDLFKNYPDFDFLLETNGMLLGNHIQQIGEIPNLNLLISMDAPEPNLYKQIRGVAAFEKVEENIEKFFNHYPKKGYLQLTRTNINEEALETFLQRWRALRDRVLIQKYNDFCKRFKDLKVVDLAPLTRFACWKLQRELFIHSDGTVSLCSQDFDKKHTLGNLLKEPIQSIWDKAQSNYEMHWNEKYPKFCENCDEWYIFSY